MGVNTGKITTTTEVSIDVKAQYSVRLTKVLKLLIPVSASI